MYAIISLLALLSVSSAFVLPQPLRHAATTTSTQLDATRRGLFTSGLAGITSVLLANSASWASGSDKILVLGGTGMVGSQVVKILNEMGVEVIATSTDGRAGTVALDLAQDGFENKIQELAKDCTAVISCVGVIGTENDKLINSASGLAAVAAKKAGVRHFAYISVAPEVREFGKGFDFLQGYMEGKALSEASIMSAFDGAYTLLEPTFIYGGDKFGLKPPRVASGYGQVVEALLSSPPFRAVTNIAPEGFIKIALEPPVSDISVAKALIAGALGKNSMLVLDTHDKIVEASKLV